MKTITFLIGNGFDVGLKMKSQYADFYRVYTDKKSKYYPKEDPGLADAIRAAKDREPHWSYYEQWFGEEYTQKHDKANGRYKERVIQRNEHFQEQFYKYLEERESKLIFSLPEGPEKRERIGKAEEMMRGALRGFYAADRIGPEGHDKILAMLKGNTVKDREYQFQFLCYNYSSVLDNCVAAVPPDVFVWLDDQITLIKGTIVKVHHPHGELKRKNETSLVMGVNDGRQLGNFFSQNTDYTKRLVKKEIMDANKHSEQYKIGEQMIAESSIIVAYGMSMGRTDKDWWACIYDWLEKDPEHRLIFYIFDPAYGSYAPNHIQSKKDEMKREFQDIVGEARGLPTESDKWHQLETQIYFAVHNNGICEGKKICERRNDKCTEKKRECPNGCCKRSVCTKEYDLRICPDADIG